MNYVTIATFNLLQEAYPIKNKLESEGIPCKLAGNHPFNVDVFHYFFVGRVKILVPEVKYYEALKILDEDLSGEIKKMEPDNDYESPASINEYRNYSHDEQERCPFCHSQDIILNKLTYPYSMLRKLTFGFLKPKPNKHYHCNICLNDWII